MFLVFILILFLAYQIIKKYLKNKFDIFKEKNYSKSVLKTSQNTFIKNYFFNIFLQKNIIRNNSYHN
jgi:hypothetical protein